MDEYPDPEVSVEDDALPLVEARVVAEFSDLVSEDELPVEVELASDGEVLDSLVGMLSSEDVVFSLEEELCSLVVVLSFEDVLVSFEEVLDSLVVVAMLSSEEGLLSSVEDHWSLIDVLSSVEDL